MGVKIPAMQPVLGQFGPLTLRTYTVLLDVAVLVGLAALAWQGWRVEDAPARWLDAGLSALVLGLVGGRLGHVTIHWAYFTANRNEIAEVWRGGLDWHGAVVGGLLGLGLYCFARRLSFRLVADVLALPLALGAALVWVGCLAEGCAYGAEVRSLADYPSPIVAELPDLYGITAPRFTSQLYGALLGVGLMLPAWLLGLLIQRVGIRLWAVLLPLALGVFAIGYTRGDVVPVAYGLRLDQVLDLGVAALALVGLVVTVATSRESGAEEDIAPDEGAAHAEAA